MSAERSTPSILSKFRAGEALTLPGVDAGVWQIRNQADWDAANLANRHYSREKQSRQIGGPGFRLILVTPCARAAWVSKRHSPFTTSARVLADGYDPDTLRCALFRNEGAGLSSELILAAMDLTERMWGGAPQGWQTYVDAAQIKSTNPGYCFKQAGWTADGWRGTKLSLTSGAVT